jgi:hypothetical protein
LGSHEQEDPTGDSGHSQDGVPRGVDGGRSQSGVGLNTNLGTSGDDEADEGGAHCTDREPMERNDAGSLGDRDMPQRLPPKVEAGHRRAKMELERLRA